MNCRTPRTPAAGFTMLELLVVVAIIAFLASMIAFLPAGDRRDADVRAAAEELAATMRAARTIAMRQAAIVGVSFNVRNGLGTSGVVLNNWDGGHWYRIIGPDEYADSTGGEATGKVAHYPRADSFSDSRNEDFTNTPGGFLIAVSRAWLGDRHVLAPHRVRFLALSDQDNGTVVDPTAGQVFPASYPRPWFGTWSAGRLYPWGGYDPTITDVRGWKCSAFSYGGKDGTIIGSRNPADRFTTWEGGGADAKQIFAAGSGRPVVNAEWLDYVLRFLPDGSVDEAPVMEFRNSSFAYRGAVGDVWRKGGLPPYGDVGDLTAYAGGASHSKWFHMAMTSYVRHTGVYAITLGPDALSDSDRFASGSEALRSMWPAYRVLVGVNGFVQVVKVQTTPPKGMAYDTTITGADWQTAAKLKTAYAYCSATNVNRTPRGMPAMDYVLPEMLVDRNWWRVSP